MIVRTTSKVRCVMPIVIWIHLLLLFLKFKNVHWCWFLYSRIIVFRRYCWSLFLMSMRIFLFLKHTCATSICIYLIVFFEVKFPWKIQSLNFWDVEVLIFNAFIGFLISEFFTLDVFGVRTKWYLILILLIL